MGVSRGLQCATVERFTHGGHIHPPFGGLTALEEHA
jgi:hypothetical protein